ncbi:MAG: SpoIID/LytB domain-containing protein [Lachnospiraceae bacterium]|nr:SpoIID/LytB domain-containing protein [Lachnospiraceae bacterium]MCM1278740.1 SpoIID/LytB domain-containing protein [Robinsoniella sp.]
MNRKKKLIWQLVGFIFLIGIMIVGTVTILNQISGRQVEGTYVKKKEAAVLIKELADSSALKQLEELEGEEESLTYGEYEKLIDAWMKEDDRLSGIGREWLEGLSAKYKKRHYLLWEDFLEFYFLTADLLAPQLEIKQEELIFLSAGDKTLDLEKNPLKPEQVLAASKDLSDVRILNLQEQGWQPQKEETDSVSQVTAITTKEKLVLLLEKSPGTITLKKAWISSNLPETVSILWKGYEMTLDKEGLAYEERQVIGDVAFSEGRLSDIIPYNEKINGKLLSIKENQMEIEGYGKLSYGDDIQVYKLYGESEDYQLSDLKIGYDFTDFVLDGKEIVAALVTREENMKNIRVVVKTTGFSGAYHEEIVFSVDTAFMIKGEGYEKRFEPGEKVTVSKESELFTSNRIFVLPDALTSKTTVYSIERGQGTPAYRGTMEIEKTDQGLLLINELLLEEYLYSVVPSEMPSSYPKEALKAQAVSARSYAYKHMQKSGLQSYGAHVDDSAAFQVYNNITESDAALSAVRETEGQVVMSKGQVADTYFYSTSCGYGTDILAWKSSQGEEEAHLTAKNIGSDCIKSAEDMKQEEEFRAFIQSVGEGDFEKEEGWYRWSYSSRLDPDIVLKQLKARYAAKPDQVLTKCEDGSFVSKEIGKLGDVKSISVLERSSGGAIHELLIEGTKGTYKVLSEHNVRYVLANEGTQVLRKSGDTSKISGMLPSAFAIVITEGEEKVESYVVIGGGFGHGIGMSQNGARAMGNLGYTYEEILQFFYDKITLSKL